MNKRNKQELIQRIVDEINLANSAEVVYTSGMQSQWDRGNGSVKRSNHDIATLSINIQEEGFAVGCDGVKKGINDFLEKEFPLNNKNKQNIRYKCSDAQIRKVIEFYAKF